MTLFLGVDGGGTKTALCLLTGDGEVLATREAPASYRAGPPGVGPRQVDQVLGEAVPALCADAGVRPDQIDFAFFALPAYGELAADQPLLDAAPRNWLGHDRYRCDNDVVCGWAGSLALADGINVVAGTGSIAYGRHRDTGARVGGWGELFGDEGSGYWVAIRGLQAFSLMSDGRAPAGPLHELFRSRFELRHDFDLLDLVLHRWDTDRTRIAALSRLVVEAAEAGDQLAHKIITDAAEELVLLVEAARRRVGFTPGEPVPVSFSGGMFNADLLRREFTGRLTARGAAYALRDPAYPPLIGAALYAAHLSGHPLTDDALDTLTKQLSAP
jgi:N-acetylglucosamine kinase-like BadF-type ATPase